MKKKLDVRTITITAILSAISIVLGLTPLGMIPIGPINATTMHIPVIVGAIICGPFVGGLVGFVFGAYSMIRAFTTPTVTSFIFMNPLVAIVPRILIGVITGYLYEILRKKDTEVTKKIVVAFWIVIIAYAAYSLIRAMQANENFTTYIFILIAAVVTLFLTASKIKAGNPAVVFASSIGSLVNTFGVMGLIYLLYAKDYMIAIGQEPDMALNFVLGVAITNGIPEMIVSTLISTPIVQAFNRRKRG